MSELGSIFGEQVDGARGPDLHFAVEVPESALGSEAGYAAAVPEEIEHEGALVPRGRGPGDPPGKIVLRLPETFASGATLRLRGQGGRDADKLPGDLFLRVTLVPGQPSAEFGSLVPWIVMAFLAGSGVALYFVL